MSKAKAAQGAGTIRQRSNGKWEARVVVGVNPGIGKPIRRSIYADTQEEARRQMTAIIRELDRGTYQAPNKIKVSDWMQEWLTTFCEGKVKPLTMQTYSGLIRNHINPAIGAMELQAVKGTHVQKLYNSMIKSGLSGKLVQNVSAVLHKSFSVAIKQGIIQTNPCDGAERPVDFPRGRITVSQQLQQKKTGGCEYFLTPTTKSGKPRTIEPPPIAFDYLRAEKRKQAENRLKAGPAWNNPDDLVFTNELGRHYMILNFCKNFKRIAAGIGRPDARPHDLRRTAATVAIASGADIKSVQELMSHATSSFGCLRPCFRPDADRYSKPDAEVLRQSERRQAGDTVRGMIRGRKSPDIAETLKPQRFQGFKLAEMERFELEGAFFAANYSLIK